MQTHRQHSDKKMVAAKTPNKAELISKKEHEEALHDDAPMSHEGTERDVSDEQIAQADESEEASETKKAAPKNSGKKPLLTAGKVKIETLLPIRLKDGTEVAQGQIVEVSEEDAKMFCDSLHKGGYNFWGTRDEEGATHNMYQYAKRV